MTAKRVLISAVIGVLIACIGGVCVFHCAAVPTWNEQRRSCCRLDVGLACYFDDNGQRIQRYDDYWKCTELRGAR